MTRLSNFVLMMRDNRAAHVWLLFVVGLFLCAALEFSYFSVEPRLHLSQDGASCAVQSCVSSSLPVIVSAANQSLFISFSPHGGKEVHALDISISGTALVKADGLTVSGGKDAFLLGQGSEFCKLRGGIYSCRIFVRVGNGPASIILQPSGPIPQFTVTSVSSDLLEFHRSTSFANFTSNPTLIAIFVLVFPLAWSLRRWPAVCDWTVVAITFVVLAAVQPRIFSVLVGMTLMVYAIGWLIRHRRETYGGKIFLFLLLPVAFSFVVKYWKFISQHFFNLSFGDLALPIGFSFFVIRLIDALMSAYRGETFSLRQVLLYVFFPGTLLAGPLESVKSFHTGRLTSLSLSDVASALERVIIGLFKKLLIADLILAPYVRGHAIPLLDLFPSDDFVSNSPYVPLYLFLCMLYAYVDFSAYSDIAIGVSRLLGFKIGENFNYPVFASSLRNYWQRWHNSMQRWCMEKVFLPVSIYSRSSTLAIFATMFVMGLWHEFRLTWAFWSVHHALGLTVLGWYSGRKGRKVMGAIPLWRKIGGVLLTQLYVVAGFAFVTFADPLRSLEVYLSYWKGVLLLPLRLLTGAS